MKNITIIIFIIFITIINGRAAEAARPVPQTLYQVASVYADLLNLQATKSGEITDQEIALAFAKQQPANANSEKLENGYRLQTGQDGKVSFRPEIGEYALKAQPIDGVFISAPSKITAKVGLNQTVYVGLSSRSIIPSNPPNPSNPPATVEQGTGLLTFAVFNDKNFNGQRDAGEPLVPWAGVTIDLTRTTEPNTFHLLEGWNLIAFPLKPKTIRTASDLIADVARQGGYVTTVSYYDNGRWQEYIQRGAIKYGQDFPIFVGVGYFLRNHKETDYKFAGEVVKATTADIKKLLQPGYNVIGLPNPNNLTASNLIKQFFGEGQVSRWESGLWESALIKNSKEYFETNNWVIEKIRGYVVKRNF